MWILMPWLIQSLGKCPEFVSTVIHVLVTSRLDNYNMLFVELPLRLAQRLQLVQNDTVQVPSGAPSQSNIMAVLQDLNWLPISD